MLAGATKMRCDSRPLYAKPLQAKPLQALRPVAAQLAVALLWTSGCLGCRAAAPARPAATAVPANAAAPVYRGLDRNEYPGDATMAALHRSFTFTGYWLTPPPGETDNTWLGKRAVLAAQGWGFLVLANGRLDAELLKSQHAHIAADALARKDAAAAVAAARREGFPAHTILFLDQEEGGRLLDEQGAYVLAWTEAVAASGYRAGVYASGQPVPDGQDAQGRVLTISTVDDLRQQVSSRRLHPIAFFSYQDACPPAPGCTLATRPLAASGEPLLNPGGDLVAWQYAQSPRRPELTRACATTYARDGNCYPPGFPQLFVDLDVASSADPSRGR